LASVQRLRPKLMTAACAALGLAPILLSGGVGAEIEKPLAIVMVGGLLTSTLFTLLVLPAVYLAAAEAKRHAQAQVRRFLKPAAAVSTPSRVSAEPETPSPGGTE
jgi:cobalt-zinc-cadmium resistance protein CzcA